MKKISVIIKGLIVFIIAATLTGCIKSFRSNQNMPRVSQGDTEVLSTQAVDDPTVMAIVNSGKLPGAGPEKIKRLLQKHTYYFGFDSNVIHKSDYKNLDALVALMNVSSYQNTKLLLEGNTDQRGTRNYNVGLGFRRANAIKDYLLAHGIDKSRIDVASFGFEKPTDPANNPVAWQKNRRVEIVLKSCSAM